MNHIVKKVVLSTILTLTFVNITQAQNIITGPHLWSALYSISGVTHGVSGVSLEECNRKLADATDGSIYVLIQPCTKA